jgi:hypothetical protein
MYVHAYDWQRETLAYANLSILRALGSGICRRMYFLRKLTFFLAKIFTKS